MSETVLDFEKQSFLEEVGRVGNLNAMSSKLVPQSLDYPASLSGLKTKLNMLDIRVCTRQLIARG